MVHVRGWQLTLLVGWEFNLGCLWGTHMLCVAWASYVGVSIPRGRNWKPPVALEAGPGTGTVLLLLVTLSVRDQSGSRTT